MELTDTKTLKLCGIESDNGYRRGYMHGYSQAMDDMEKHGWKECAEFFNEEVSRWRYIPEESTWEPPVLIAKTKDALGEV